MTPFETVCNLVVRPENLVAGSSGQGMWARQNYSTHHVLVSVFDFGNTILITSEHCEILCHLDVIIVRVGCLQDLQNLATSLSSVINAV
jgi:hypothetical protein